MRKTFKYRLFTTRLQEAALDIQLGEACRLYNAALQERRDAYKTCRKSLNYYDQANQLREIRAAKDSGLTNYSCSQDVLRRVDKAFKAFFRRVKTGENPGYPRFKSPRRFDSITFPSYGNGIRLNGGMLRVQGSGISKSSSTDLLLELSRLPRSSGSAVSGLCASPWSIKPNCFLLFPTRLGLMSG